MNINKSKAKRIALLSKMVAVLSNEEMHDLWDYVANYNHDHNRLLERELREVLQAHGFFEEAKPRPAC